MRPLADSSKHGKLLLFVCVACITGMLSALKDLVGVGV